MKVDGLVDLDFLEARWREGAQGRAAAWLQAHRDWRLGLPWTVRAGFLRLGREAVVPKDALREFLSRYPTHFPDEETVDWYVRLPRTEIAEADLWTAASALRLGVPLVSRKTATYGAIPGLNLEPFGEPGEP